MTWLALAIVGALIGANAAIVRGFYRASPRRDNERRTIDR